MEKPHVKFSVPQIFSFFRAMVERSMNANTLWRVMIGSVFVVTLGICIFTYLTYTWANSIESQQVPTKKDHDTFSPADLKKAIAIYHAKEGRYNDLLSTRPTAPLYAKGAGVLILSPQAPQEHITASGTPPLVPTSTPSLLRK